METEDVSAAEESPGPWLAGRRVEEQLLARTLHSAASGRPAAVVLHGEAGVGKTRLVRHVCHALSPETQVLWGTSVHFGEASVPFAPVTGALQAWLARADAATRAEIMSGAGELGAVMPALAEGGPVEPGRLLPLLDLVFNRLADRAPTVVVVDDLHWADRSSLDVLAYLITGFREQRLALLATCRDEHRGDGHPLHTWLADMRRLPHFTEIHLDRLDLAATEDQIQGLLGRAVDIALATQVQERSDGNPYLTELLVRGLAGDELELPVTAPAALREALLASWHGLSPEARQATQVLSVGGRPTDIGVLADVAAEHGVPRASLVGCLVEARDHGVVRLDVAGRPWFRHPLLAEVLYYDLPPGGAAHIHSEYARVLELLPDNRPVRLAADLAIHNQQAGRIDNAYRWSLVAADDADRLHASAELAIHLERACSLWDKVSPDLRRDSASRVGLLRRASAAADRAGQLRSAIALAEQAMDHVDRNREPLLFSTLLREWSLTYLRNLAPDTILHSAHIEGVELTRSVPDSPEHARALASLSMAEHWDGLQDAAVTHAEHAVQVGRRSGSHAALADALIARTRTATNSPLKALADAEEAEQLARLCDDSLLIEDAAMWRVSSLVLLGRVDESIEVALNAFHDVLAAGSLQWGYYLAAQAADGLLQLGRWQECRDLLRTALAARCGGVPDAAVRLRAARLAARTGDITAARDHLDRALELVSPHYPILSRQLSEVGAEVLVGCCEPARALAWLHGRMLMRHTEAVLNQEEFLVILAHVAAEAAVAARDEGDHDSALRAVAALDEVVKKWPGEPFSGHRWDAINQAASRALYAAEAARCRGDSGQSARWREAIEHCQAAGWPWHEAVSRLRCAEAMFDIRSSRSAIGELLRDAHRVALKLGARPLVNDVESLARSARVNLREPVPLEVAPGAPPALANLTDREKQILTYLVAGRSNTEIANELVISDKTVSVHVSNILRKTGTSTRLEAAALAARISHRHQ
ncbi:AAA family ATPase [Kribbella qitaiheensis]|uniref:helix-turn-helix transcriptional regulator n=1 Tax=Kribbella qitaiheensis TaxID=1544730 RepID=UPI003614A032